MTEPTSTPRQYVQESIFSQIEVLRRQIIAAQVAGLLLIVVPAIWIGHQAEKHVFLALSIIALTALYFALIYRDVFVKRRILSSAVRIQRYRTHLGWLIAVDALLCLGLIGLSGGFPDSHLSFVFLLIPCSVGFIRGGGRTLRHTVLIVIAIVITETLWKFPSSSLAWLLTRRFSFLPFASRDSPNYSFVVAFGIIVGVALAWYQSFVAAGSSLSDHVMTANVDILRAANIDPETIQALTDCVSKAYHHMSRTISLTNEPVVHCSVVHPLDDVVFQAYVLALPAKTLSSNVRATMQAAAEVTFAAHWLDDAFDWLGYDRLTDNQTLPTVFDIQTIDTDAIADYYHPYGIRRILLEVKARTRWREGSEMGLMRIICGGFIQGLEGKHRKAAATRILTDAQKAIHNQELEAALLDANVAFLWGIAKSDMPLVVSIYLTGDYHLHSACLILDALFMPLLVWHDLETELSRESVSKHGFEGHSIKREVADAVGLAVKCIDIGLKHGLKDNKVVRGIEPVLRLVYHQYEARLPKGGFYEDYRRAISAWLQN